MPNDLSNAIAIMMPMAMKRYRQRRHKSKWQRNAIRRPTSIGQARLRRAKSSRHHIPRNECANQEEVALTRGQDFMAGRRSMAAGVASGE